MQFYPIYGSIYDIAEVLKISASTVSRAFKPDSKINPEKRRLILETADKMGYVQNKMASRLSMKPINIAVMVYGRFKPFYTELLRGIEMASQTLSDYKVNCTTFVFALEDYTEQQALEQLRSVHAEDDGLIIHGFYGEEAAAIVDELVERGTKVATLHNDILPSRRLFTSMNNTELTGNVAAQLLDIFLPANRRKVVMFSGHMKSLVHQTLTFSFIRHAEEYNLQLLRHYATDDYPEKARQTVEQVFKEFSEIDGIYISSGNSEPICRYIDENGLSDRVAIIASDIFPELSTYIRRGIVKATIYQDPFGQGYKAFEGLYYHIAEGRTINSIVMVDPQIVIRSNLSAYERWRAKDTRPITLGIDG